MGIDQVVVTGVVIVILMALFVIAFDYLIPVIKKIEFDAICRNYVLVAEAQNGLTSEDVGKLQTEIEQMGVQVTVVECSEINEAKRRSLNAFRVEGIYKKERLISIFKREQQDLKFLFEQAYLSRKIIM